MDPPHRNPQHPQPKTAPRQRKMQHKPLKMVARETWSDATTGVFAFDGIDTRQEFITLAEDAAGLFRPVAANKLVPEVVS